MEYFVSSGFVVSACGWASSFGPRLMDLVPSGSLWVSADARANLHPTLDQLN